MGIHKMAPHDGGTFCRQSTISANDPLFAGAILRLYQLIHPLLLLTLRSGQREVAPVILLRPGNVVELGLADATAVIQDQWRLEQIKRGIIMRQALLVILLRFQIIPKIIIIPLRRLTDRLAEGPAQQGIALGIVL